MKKPALLYKTLEASEGFMPHPELIGEIDLGTLSLEGLICSLLRADMPVLPRLIGYAHYVAARNVEVANNSD